MKTNKILMAMVLAAGFTACTSEELVESTQTVSLNNRKALGDIEFVVGGVDSRFTQTEDGWVFDGGDAFGAALVDTYNGKKNANAWKNYNLSEFIQTNYQYAKGEGNVFTTPARMVEGNYVFYAPYNAKHLARTAMETAFPINQTLDVVDGVVDPYSTINNAVAEGYPFFIDYKFLSAADQETSLTINFKHIYAYPEVKFVNETEEAIDIEKFIVKLGGTTTVSANGVLNLTGGSNTYAKAGNGIVGKLYNLGTEKTDVVTTGDVYSYGAWVAYNAKNGRTGATSDVVTAAGAAKTTHIVVEIPEGLTVEAGEEVVFNIVLPAENYTNMELFAMVNDEKGYAARGISAKFAPGKRYPTTDYKENGELKSKVGSKFTLTVEEDEKAVNQPNAIAPIVVSSTDELKDVIAATEKSVLNVITGEGVKFDASVAEVLKESEVVNKLVILGDITVEGGATAATALTLSKVEFTGKTTIDGIVKTTVDLAEVIVNEDATLNIEADAAVEIASLTNEGTVNAKKNAVIEASINNNIINIEHKTADVTVENYGTLNINAAGTVDLTNAFDTDDTTGNDTFGTVNVACNFSTDKLEGYWNVNSGKLNVTKPAEIAKKVKVAGKLEGAEVTVLGGATLEVSGRFNTPVVLKGKVDADATTEGNQPSVATLDLKEGAVIGANVTPASSTDATCNLMKIEDDVENMGGFAVNANICSQYTYSGSITGESGEDGDKEIPAECNTLVLTGSIKATEYNVNFTSYASTLSKITVGGDVYTNNSKTITFKNNTTIVIAGDVEANGGVIEFSNSNVTIGGDMKIKVANGVASTGKIIVGEEIIATADVATALVEVVAKGDITLPSQTGDLRIGTLHVENDLSVYGTRTLGAGKIIVYEGCTLTNEATIGGYNSVKVEFVSSYKANHKVVSEPTQAEITAGELVRGQVDNQGTVKNKKESYAEGTTYPWWTGAAAID